MEGSTYISRIKNMYRREVKKECLAIFYESEKPEYKLSQLDTALSIRALSKKRWLELEEDLEFVIYGE